MKNIKALKHVEMYFQQKLIQFTTIYTIKFSFKSLSIMIY